MSLCWLPLFAAVAHSLAYQSPCKKKLFAAFRFDSGERKRSSAKKGCKDEALFEGGASKRNETVEIPVAEKLKAPPLLLQPLFHTPIIIYFHWYRAAAEVHV